MACRLSVMVIGPPKDSEPLIVPQDFQHAVFLGRRSACCEIRELMACELSPFAPGSPGLGSKNIVKAMSKSIGPARLDDDVREGYTEPGSIARQIPLWYTSTSINLPNFSFGLGVEQKIFRQRFCVSRRRPAAGSRT